MQLTVWLKSKLQQMSSYYFKSYYCFPTLKDGSFIN